MLYIFVPIIIILIIIIIFQYIKNNKLVLPCPPETSCPTCTSGSTPCPSCINKTTSISPELASAIAKMIVSSSEPTVSENFRYPTRYYNNKVKEYFETVDTITNVNTIATLLQTGQLSELEKKIDIKTVSDNLTSTAETISPVLVKDAELVPIIATLKLESDLVDKQNELENLQLVLETSLQTTTSPTDTTQIKADSDLATSIAITTAKIIELQTELNKQSPLANAISNISDPDKLEKLTEIQNKIQLKRDKQKQKHLDKLSKENPKLKTKIEEKKTERKQQSILEKKQKINEEIAKKIDKINAQKDKLTKKKADIENIEKITGRKKSSNVYNSIY